MLKKSLIASFFISLPVVLYLLIIILPTFDDWTYITSPYFGNALAADRILPWNGYWRPFDALIGSLLGLDYRLFPALNHALILLGHAVSTYLVYRLAHRHILPAAFFFLSPGMLGAVLDIDSANQVFSTCWGLASLLLYSKGRKWQWMACVIIATFCKENGIMYAVIPPIISYGSESSMKNIRPYVRDMVPMAVLVGIYGVARIMLTSADNAVLDDYLNVSMMDHAKDIVQYVSFTWIALDFESVVYPPTRCMPLAIATALLSLPFLLLLAKGAWARRREKMHYVLLAAYFIAAAPHLLTLVSLMHVYSGLPFAALIIDRCYDRKTSWQRLAIAAFFVAAAITDIHHWHEAYQSGLAGKEMAEDVISKSKTKPQSVFILNIDNGEEKYSTINVIPRDAFGWGRAARHYSGYAMANEISDTTILAPASATAMQKLTASMADSIAATHAYDAFWVVDGKKVEIVFEK